MIIVTMYRPTVCVAICMRMSLILIDVIALLTSLRRLHIGLMTMIEVDVSYA